MLVVRVRERTGMGSVPVPRVVLTRTNIPKLINRNNVLQVFRAKIICFFNTKINKFLLFCLVENAGGMFVFLLMNRSADLDLKTNYSHFIIHI